MITNVYIKCMHTYVTVCIYIYTYYVYIYYIHGICVYVCVCTTLYAQTCIVSIGCVNDCKCNVICTFHLIYCATYIIYSYSNK